MYLKYLCPPAFLYLCFALTHIIIDLYNNLFNTALFKFVLMVIYTIALNILCINGYMIFAWILVFIPFVLMTIVISLLLFVFGFSPKSGTLLDEINSEKYIECSDTDCKVYI